MADYPRDETRTISSEQKDEGTAENEETGPVQPEVVKKKLLNLPDNAISNRRTSTIDVRRTIKKASGAARRFVCLRTEA